MKSHFNERSLAGIYEAVGGIEALRRISQRFHHRVEQDPVLRGLFPKNMVALEERLALFLAERTGGPADYTATRGKTSLLCRHAHLAIGTLEAEHWLEHLRTSLVEEGVRDDAAALLLANLTELAATLADPLILLYELPLDELRARLQADPALALVNDHGRNLLCAAAIAWDVPRLRLLLEFGADIETKDTGGHNALYRVANGSGREEDGRAALELLIAHGARVNQTTGVGGMTPLHMAARRGTVALAEALLGAGATPDARDTKGETPLRRAVNCGHEGIVRLLLAHGANPLSQDRQGRTVLDAARHEPIRALLQTL
ncbi:ankyrin repeat domain-containing protein [Armatimonas rosea]|uniref:Hemoglobin n=1 Tax=Armatimonas rosea TaxID=685828 RepID=A0A7W9W726_ARMRO|nr:ankyrin repeat domain-containing protein [Armatimonas rosea]MBB6050670.1 hemoglobin [Armatimonas rosea]